MQAQVGADADRNSPFSISTVGKDGKPIGIGAWLPTGVVYDSFSKGGEFETMFAKAFVVSSYHTWEEVTRPKIAQALGISHRDVQSDLMGEWRHLRNWLVHPSEETEKTFFSNTDLLSRIPGCPKPGNVPKVKADMILPMMGYLNHLHVIANPKNLDPGMEIGQLEPALAEQITTQVEPGVVLTPLWHGFKQPEM